MKREKKKSYFHIFMVIAFILVIGGLYIFILMQQQETEMTNYLYELSKKEADIISQQMQTDINYLREIEKEINRKTEINKIIEIVQQGNSSNQFFEIIIEINNTNYFIYHAIEESILKEIITENNISKEIKINANKYYAYEIPLVQNNKQIGKIIGIKNSENIKRITDTNIFYGQGYSQIISNQGNLLIRSDHPSGNKVANNISELKFFNKKQEKRLEQDLLKGNSGLTKIIYEKEKIKKIMVYVPLGINNLYICTLIPENIIGIEFTKIILLSIVLIISVIITIIQFIFFINKQKEKNREIILDLAYKDELTKGFNKNKFIVESTILKKEQYNIVMLNIKYFKNINQILGRKMGDKFLIYIYECIRKNLMKKEIVSRVKDDVFYMMILNSKIEEKMKEVIKEIKEFKPLKEINYPVSITIGIYRIKKEDYNKPIEELMDKAKYASNTEKEINYYSKEIEEEIMNRHLIEKRMEQGIIKKEFILYVQPKYEIKTEKIMGGEILVRWKVEDQIIYPDKFIPIFEENNFIKKLDLYLLNELGEVLKKWKNKKYKIEKISINQSPKNIYNNEYISKIKKIIEEKEIPTDLLEIELTENIFIEEQKRIAILEKELHQLGLTIAMDDFGKGYSSYDLLGKINIDVLKVDKKLIDSMQQNIKAKIVVEGIINMAKKMKIEVVAEGVENKEQVELLKEMNCDTIQGYYFSKPVTIEEFEELIKDEE